MKLNGIQVFGITQALISANSKKGQARSFLRVNKDRFAPLYKEVVGWVADFEDEYDELTVQKTQDGDVVAFNFDVNKSAKGQNAFVEWMAGQEYEVEPYAMTQSVLDWIDGIDVQQEQTLFMLTTEYKQTGEQQGAHDAA